MSKARTQAKNNRKNELVNEMEEGTKKEKVKNMRTQNNDVKSCQTLWRSKIIKILGQVFVPILSDGH